MGKEDLPENEMFQECIPLHRVTLASCWLEYAAERIALRRLCPFRRRMFSNDFRVSTCPET
jgi:hypothetical protein